MVSGSNSGSPESIQRPKKLVWIQYTNPSNPVNFMEGDLWITPHTYFEQEIGVGVKRISPDLTLNAKGSGLGRSPPRVIS